MQTASRLAVIPLMMVAVISGASAVELGFSMDAGGNSIGVNEYYNVGLDAAVDESISANPVSSTIGVSKAVAGSGYADVRQSLSSSAYSVDGQILITDASSYSIAGSVTFNPCAISTQQAFSSAGGTSQSLLAGIYGLEGVTQYAGVGQGSLNSMQSLTFADGVSASQSVAASGLDPWAAMTVGAMTFDPANGDLIGDGGFAAVGANGPGEIQSQIVARSVKGQPLASTVVYAPVLAVTTPNTGSAALGVGNMIGNLYAGQVAGQGAIGLITVSQGSFLGQAAGFTERYVDTLPDCDLLALTDPAVSLSVIGLGEMAAAGVAAGSIGVDLPRAAMGGQGALMAIAATDDAFIFGSLLAETDGATSYAGGADIFAVGDGMALAGGAAGAVDADLLGGYIGAEAGLVGLGGIGAGSRAWSDLMEVEVGDSVYANGYSMMAAGGDVAAIAAGVAGAGLDLNTGMAGAGGAFAGVGAGGDALALAGYIGASSDELGVGAGAIRVSAFGDAASAAAAGVLGGGIDLSTLYLEAGGALVGAGAGGSGFVSALALGAGMDALGLGAEGDSVVASGEDVALIGAGVADIDFDIAGLRLGAGGALAGAGAGGNGLVLAESLFAEMDADGLYAEADSAIAGGDSAAAIVAGATDVKINLNKLRIVGDAALAGVGAGENGEVAASHVDAGIDQWGAFARGETLHGSGDTAAVAAAGAGKVDLKINKNKYEALGSLVGVGAGENGVVDAGYLYAETWPLGIGISPSRAWGNDLEASGDTAAVAMAGSADVFLNLNNGKIIAEGALAGVGAGENGVVEASYLETYVGNSAGAYGEGLIGIGDTAAIAAAGAAAVKGKGVSLDLTQGKIEASGAIVGAGALNQGVVSVDHFAATIEDDVAIAEGSDLMALGGAAAALAGAGDLEVDIALMDLYGSGAIAFAVGGGSIGGVVAAGLLEAQTGPIIGASAEEIGAISAGSSGSEFALTGAGAGVIELNPTKLEYVGSLAGVMAMGDGLRQTMADQLNAEIEGSRMEASATNAFAKGAGLTAGAISVHSGDGADTGAYAGFQLDSGEIRGNFYTMVEENGNLHIEASADNFILEGTGIRGGVSAYNEDLLGRLESDLGIIASDGIVQGSLDGYVTTGSAMTGAHGSGLSLQGNDLEMFAQSWYGDASLPSDCAIVWIDAGMGSFSNSEFQTDGKLKAKTKMVTSGSADFTIVTPGTVGSWALSPSDMKLDAVPLPASSSGHADLMAKRKKDETVKVDTVVV